jgi:hypothetical protein
VSPTCTRKFQNVRDSNGMHPVYVQVNTSVAPLRVLQESERSPMKLLIAQGNFFEQKSE